MSVVPARVGARIAAGLKKFQPVLEDARKRDVNESDTVTIVTDLLSEVFGFDKYSEVTSEHVIRSTFCDLAIRIDGKLAVLIEVKAIGLDLKDNHIKQAVDYAANQGCEWVALTNGVLWNVYQVAFTKPIQSELVLQLDLCLLSLRRSQDLELLALLSREAWKRSRMDDYAVQRQALSRFTIAAVILSEPCVHLIRRQLRRITKDVRVDAAEIEKVLLQEVLKREATEGDKAAAATRLAARATKRLKKVQEEAAKPTSGS